MTASKTGAENKVRALEQKEQELQALLQQLSIDLQRVSGPSVRSGPRFPGLVSGIRANSVRSFHRRMAADTSSSHSPQCPSSCSSQVAFMWRERRFIMYCDFCFHLQVTAETQEKSKLITHFQEKVASLEKRLEQNLSGEEHVQELLKEVIRSLHVSQC